MPFGKLTSRGKLQAAGKWVDANKPIMSNRVGPAKKRRNIIGTAIDRTLRKGVEFVGKNLKDTATAATKGRKVRIGTVYKRDAKPTRIGGVVQKAKDAIKNKVDKSEFVKRKRWNLDKDERAELRQNFKQARLSTPAEKAKMRAYRMANKAKLARKAKIRRMKQRTGVQRKKKRIGAASSGYSFVMDPKAGPSFGGGSKANLKGHKGLYDFDPSKNPSTTERKVTLKPL